MQRRITSVTQPSSTTGKPPVITMDEKNNDDESGKENIKINKQEERKYSLLKKKPVKNMTNEESQQSAKSDLSRKRRSNVISISTTNGHSGPNGHSGTSSSYEAPRHKRISMGSTTNSFMQLGLNDSQHSRRIKINNDENETAQVSKGSNIKAKKSDTGAVAAAALKELDEAVQRALEMPHSKDYDPIKTVEPHRVCFVMKEIRDQFKHIYYQPDLPDNNVKVPYMNTVADNNVFYLFEMSDIRKRILQNRIKKLGGTVTNYLYKATRLIFCPTNQKMSSESLFLFATAAIGGRYLLPFCYIFDSTEKKKFIDVTDYSSDDYYISETDLDPSTLAAIKMSNVYRNHYFHNRYPRFHHSNILLAAQRPKDEDVELLLQILGAYVQRCYDENQFLSNPLYTLCVTSDDKIKLPDEAKLIPYATADNIRSILWKTLQQFK